MRVLHLIKTAHGASWAVRQTAQLVKQGHEVHVALPDGPMVAKYEQAGVTAHRLSPAVDMVRPWQTPRRVADLQRCIQRVQPDLVHSHFVASTLLMRLAMRGTRIPRIFHIPGPLHLEHPLFRQLDLQTAGAHDFYLASCKWTQHTLTRHGVAPARVGLAYYGVNEEDFLKPAGTTLSLTELFPDDSAPFIVGMVAYFYGPKYYLGQRRGLKGHEDLIDALAIVRRRHPQVKAVFVGGPWGGAQRYYEKVQRYARQTLGDAAVFLGQRNDVPSLYPQFQLAVHPSHSENVGGAVESMYARVLTLTSDVGGFPDLLVPGKTGYMAQAKSASSLAAEICRAVENQASAPALINQAFEQVSAVMNVEHNAREVSDFYQHVMKTHGGQP